MSALREPKRPSSVRRVAATVGAVLVGVLVVLFGVAMIGAGAEQIKENHQLNAGHPLRSTAVVTEGFMSTGSTPEDQIRVSFFTTAGKKIEATVQRRPRDHYRDGQRVAVEYLRDDPHVARLAGVRSSLAEAHRILAIGIVVLVLSAALGVWLALPTRRGTRRSGNDRPEIAGLGEDTSVGG